MRENSSVSSEWEELNFLMNQGGSHKILTREEETELNRRWREYGDKEALQELAECNLRFVVRIARNYIGQGMSLADLVQEGFVGAMIAASKFKAELGYKYTTYAVWWIEQTIMRALNNLVTPVRIPIGTGDEVGKIRRARERLVTKQGSAPDDEVAESLGISTDRLREITVITYRKTVGLDSKDRRTERETRNFHEVIPDWHAADPYFALEAKEQYEASLCRIQRAFDAVKKSSLLTSRHKILFRALYCVDKLPEDTFLSMDSWMREHLAYEYGLHRGGVAKAIERLTKDQRKILTHKFGIGLPLDSLTLDAVGKKYGVSRERVRQIRNKCFKRVIGRRLGFTKESFQEEIDKLRNLAEMIGSVECI